MKKIGLILAALLLMVGCAQTPKTPEATATPSTTPETAFKTELSVLSPTGAPALALLDVLNNGSSNINLVDGSDVIQAAFLNPNPEYDVIIAPTNLGAKLASVNKTEYRLAGIVTWGNLFILGVDGANLQDESKTLAAFGEAAVPGLVFNHVIENMGIKANVVYYNSVAEAQAALLSGKADMALIAEPAATATIAKAKQEGKELSILADIQQEWQKVTGFEGYPQAGVFVLQSSYADKKEEVDALLEQLNITIQSNTASTPEALAVLIAKVGTELLGVPSETVVAKAYANLNLNYVSALEVKEELAAFLALFEITEIDSIYLK